MTDTTSSLAAAVDYLTLTTKTPGASQILVHAIQGVLSNEQGLLLLGKDWRFMGFRGRAFEGVRYGLRGDEGILMLSGSWAGKYWRSLAKFGDRCTRIDLAVTLTLADRDDSVARDAYERALDAAVVSSALIVNSRSGRTCYLGSRSSRYFCRLYDKGAEQGADPGFIWRWELEVKKPAGDPVLAALLAADNPAEYIRDRVRQQFSLYGVLTPWLGLNTIGAMEISADVMTPERSLRWLSTQVKPTVSRLILAGFEVEVRDALSLPDTDPGIVSLRKDMEEWQSTISIE